MLSATREFYSRSHDIVIRVYDEAGNVIDTHEHKGEFQRVLEVRARTAVPLKLFSGSFPALSGLAVIATVVVF